MNSRICFSRRPDEKHPIERVRWRDHEYSKRPADVRGNLQQFDEDEVAAVHYGEKDQIGWDHPFPSVDRGVPRRSHSSIGCACVSAEEEVDSFEKEQHDDDERGESRGFAESVDVDPRGRAR